MEILPDDPRAGRPANWEDFSSEIVGFDALGFYVFERLIAFRVRGQFPVLGPNIVLPTHPEWATVEHYRTLLDWAGPGGPAQRLERDAFLAAWQVARAPIYFPWAAPPRPVDAHGHGTGVAWVHTRAHDGCELREADSPHDVWPGAEADGPLGRAGFWVGTPAVRLWVGPSLANGLEALSIVHDIDLMGWGCTWVDDVPTGPVSPPPGVPRTPVDLLVQVFREYPTERPEGQFRAFVDGCLYTTELPSCALCGIPAAPRPVGFGRIYLCTACGERALIPDPDVDGQ